MLIISAMNTAALDRVKRKHEIRPHIKVSAQSSHIVTFRGLRHYLPDANSSRMKSSAQPQALRLAQLRAGKCIRVAHTDKKAAHAAKIKFKAAKKIWKQSRKQAKRSAKLAKLAQKELATLAKKLRRAKSQEPGNKSPSPASVPAKPSIPKKVRRRTRLTPRTAPQPPETASPALLVPPAAPSQD
jgi:hypothetical protein